MRSYVVDVWLTIVARRRPEAFTTIVKLFHEPQYLKDEGAGEDTHSGITDIDCEEQTAGYQAAYSRLAASESPEVDPVGYVRDPRDFLAQELARIAKTDGSQLKMMLEATGAVGRPLLQSLIDGGWYAV